MVSVACDRHIIMWCAVLIALGMECMFGHRRIIGFTFGGQGKPSFSIVAAASLCSVVFEFCLFERVTHEFVRIERILLVCSQPCGCGRFYWASNESGQQQRRKQTTMANIHHRHGVGSWRGASRTTCGGSVGHPRQPAVNLPPWSQWTSSIGSSLRKSIIRRDLRGSMAGGTSFGSPSMRLFNEAPVCQPTPMPSVREAATGRWMIRSSMESG